MSEGTANREHKLRSTMDANVWAEEFIKLFKDRFNEIDQDLMRAWFANAIMCGWDHQYWKLEAKVSALETKVKGYEKILGILELKLHRLNAGINPVVPINEVKNECAMLIKYIKEVLEKYKGDS